MEVLATTTSPAAGLHPRSPGMGSDASQTPGRDVPKSPETANGLRVDGLRPGHGATASPPPATLPEPVRKASMTPPSAQPRSTEPPSTQPPIATGLPLTQPPPTYPPPTQTPSTQTPLTQLPLTQLPSIQPPPAYPSSTSAPSPGFTPALSPPSQFRQFHRQSRENGVPRRFPSPNAGHEPPNPTFNRDLSLLADTIQRSSPEAVRRTVRDKWEKCLIGSEFHHAFLLNAIIHHARGGIVRRAIRDFGRKLISEAKLEIAEHLSLEDLDDIAPTILKTCSDRFLDKALEQRLATIDATSLINALARAERLGYTNSDVVVGDQQKRVVPTAPMMSPEAPHIAQFQPQPTAPPPPRFLHETQHAQNASPASDLKCRLCWREFNHPKNYEYHVAKQVCSKTEDEKRNHKFWCDDCGAGFTTKAGLQYHNANAVCGPHGTATATPRHLTQVPSTPRPYSTPFHLNTKPVETPSPVQDDPYGHLTAQTRARLDEELQRAEIEYAKRFKEAELIADEEGKKSKLESLQNGYSTKQSTIRKKYGVRLRVRRTRTEIEQERARMMGFKHGPSLPDSAADMPPAKRQRSDDGSNQAAGPSYVGRDPLATQAHASAPPPPNLLSVFDMNNSGLGGSTATAATTDPTASAPPSRVPSAPAEKEPSPPNSLSSLQRQGYRVSSHVGRAAPPREPAPESPALRSGSATAPLVLDDDSSDDTDTDGEIPATLPPKKAS
ncbi:hypothetical protein F4802DRAFT_584624 [Xylaria palmicola]|nr:hypothetical protein F4802DRAFT_584624 [Xylaria palmicola]